MPESLVNYTVVVNKSPSFLNEDITFRVGIQDARPVLSRAVIVVPAGQSSGTATINNQLLPCVQQNVQVWDGNTWVDIPQTDSGGTDNLADLDPSKDYGIAFHGYRINVT